MHCQFCQNFHLSQEYKKYANYQTVSPKELIDYVNNIKNNIGIAFTYNEPFISYEFIRDCLPFIKRTKLKVVLVSNGMINLGPLTKIINEIDAFNIDLKAFTNSFYQKHGGMLDSIKQTISAIVLAKKHIELTLLVIPGENDSEVDMEKMAK
jgi:pyruvate formate lyase activating enzyme